MRMSYIQMLSSSIMNRRFRNEGEQAWVCSDPEVRSDFRNTPKCNFSFTANGFHNLMSMLSEAYSSDIWNGVDRRFPVLMLSARGEEYDRINGFELGIDDYVVKPFSPKELMMRI